jgi:hypothetical protein
MKACEVGTIASSERGVKEQFIATETLIIELLLITLASRWRFGTRVIAPQLSRFSFGSALAGLPCVKLNANGSNPKLA